MKTKILKINPENPEADFVAEAAEVLKRGGLVAFPTETVYGLGGNGLDAEACKKIYEAKGRPSDNPLILHISQISELRPIVGEIPPVGEALMEAFWPGPLTMIFPKSELVPLSVTGGLDTVAVRFPTHPVALAIIRKAGLPIAGPSANSSGKPSPTRASHVEFDLSGKIDMIVDGGASQWGLESTIVDVSGDVPVILRPGAITKEMMEEVVGAVEIDPAILAKPTKDLRPKAPGMKYTHYSPKAEVTMVAGEAKQVVETINNLVAKHHADGKTVGVLATEETKKDYTADDVLSLGRKDDLEEIGANLYKHLRKFDFHKMDFVYAEVFSEEGEGLAIMNRLQKAAGYRRIDV